MLGLCIPDSEMILRTVLWASGGRRWLDAKDLTTVLNHTVHKLEPVLFAMHQPVAPSAGQAHTPTYEAGQIFCHKPRGGQAPDSV